MIADQSGNRWREKGERKPLAKESGDRWREKIKQIYRLLECVCVFFTIYTTGCASVFVGASARGGFGCANRKAAKECRPCPLACARSVCQREFAVPPRLPTLEPSGFPSRCLRC